MSLRWNVIVVKLSKCQFQVLTGKLPLIAFEVLPIIRKAFFNWVNYLSTTKIHFFIDYCCFEFVFATVWKALAAFFSAPICESSFRPKLNWIYFFFDSISFTSFRRLKVLVESYSWFISRRLFFDPSSDSHKFEIPFHSINRCLTREHSIGLEVNKADFN